MPFLSLFIVILFKKERAYIILINLAVAIILFYLYQQPHINSLSSVSTCDHIANFNFLQLAKSMASVLIYYDAAIISILFYKPHIILIYLRQPINMLALILFIHVGSIPSILLRFNHSYLIDIIILFIYILFIIFLSNEPSFMTFTFN